MSNREDNSEWQRQEDEEQLWREHYRHCKELEEILTDMGVPHQKVKERE